MATIAYNNSENIGRGVSPEALSLAEQWGVVDELARIEALTLELFPGDCSVEVHHDPEIPGYSLIVFNAIAQGPAEHVARRNDLWIQQLIELVPNRPSRFCLSLDYQD